jgi:hypothetical protein
VGVSILLPNRRLEFTTSGTVVSEYFMRVELGIREAYRALAYWNDSVWDVNDRIITHLRTRFEVACACLVLAIALWSLSLA